MKTKYLLLATALLTLCGGCATVAPVAAPSFAVESEWDDAASSTLLVDGRATLTGQAFLKTRGGDVKVGAGEIVHLYPSTGYVRELLEIQSTGYTPTNYGDAERKRMLALVRKTVADAEGRFSFESLPAGEFIVSCDIFWEIPGLYGMMERTGSRVSKPVVLAAGETVTVMLTL